jgi:hypothetical protein
MSMRQAPVILMSLLLLSSAASADDLIGQARVLDGDTLEIHGERASGFGRRCT